MKSALAGAESTADGSPGKSAIMEKAGLEGSASGEGKAQALVSKATANTTANASAAKKDEKKADAIAKGGCCVIA